MLVDFHSHTHASDGTLAPEALVAAMRTRGVEVFSVTDHDSLAAYEGLDGAVDSGRIIVGVEINTTYRANEVHILGYGFALEAPELRRMLGENRRHRVERATRIVAQLQRAGYPLEDDDVRAETASEDTALGRPHVAKALVRRGVVRDVETAFRLLLSPGRPGYAPRLYVDPREAIAVIARAGGVAVLAHPGRLDDEVLIDELVESGLAGLEVFYPTHPAGQVAHFRRKAAAYGLVMTAGSDFHDASWNGRGVGVEVDADDVRGFLDLVL